MRGTQRKSDVLMLNPSFKAIKKESNRKRKQSKEKAIKRENRDQTHLEHQATLKTARKAAGAW